MDEFKESIKTNKKWTKKNVKKGHREDKEQVWKVRLVRHINEQKIWLDDVRKAPSGWIHIKTVEDLIPFFEKNYNKIKEMSLDHDLGENIMSGYDFITWLEEKVFAGKYKTIPNIKIHSANPVGRKKMTQGLDSINRKI